MPSIVLAIFFTSIKISHTVYEFMILIFLYPH